MGHFKGKHFNRRIKEGGVVQELSCMIRPHISRLCFLADALTYFRIVAALMILVATIMGYDADWVLVWFVIGELTDAFDGICARTFLYPRDGKRRLWREYASEIDQFADIFLSVAMLAFLNYRLGMYMLDIVLIVALIVQLLRDWIEWAFGPKACEIVILARRLLYVLAVVFAGFYTTFQTAFFRSLDDDWQMAIVFATIVSLITLALFKRDRATEEKTVTKEPKLTHMKLRRRLQQPTPRGVPSFRHRVIRVRQMSPWERHKMMKAEI